MSSLSTAQPRRYDRPLPPPRRAAMPAQVWQKRISGRPRRRLAARVLEDMEVRYVVSTRSFVDIGGWLGPRPIAVVVTPYELVLLADGYVFDAPEPFVARLPLRQAQTSIYNHVTGRLALAPAPDLPVKSLKVNPIVGYQLLSQIHHEGA